MYTKKIQATQRIFHGISLEHYITSIWIDLEVGECLVSENISRQVQPERHAQMVSTGTHKIYFPTLFYCLFYLDVEKIEIKFNNA